MLWFEFFLQKKMMIFRLWAFSKLNFLPEISPLYVVSSTAALKLNNMRPTYHTSSCSRGLMCCDGSKIGQKWGVKGFKTCQFFYGSDFLLVHQAKEEEEWSLSEKVSYGFAAGHSRLKKFSPCVLSPKKGNLVNTPYYLPQSLKTWFF